MATKTKSKTEDQQSAIVRAAMARADKVIEAGMGDSKLKLDEGGHEVELTIEIKGGLSMGKGSPGGVPSTVIDVTSEDVLAAVVVDMDDDELKERISVATKKIAMSRADTKAAANHTKQVEKARTLVLELIEKEGTSRGLTKKTYSAARSGSLTGKPDIKVTGKFVSNGKEIAIK